MPQEGTKSVTLPVFRIEQVKRYFNAHKSELRKMGIKSPSALISFWVSEKLIEYQ